MGKIVMKKYRLLSYALVFTLILSSFSITTAAKKPKLSKKNISLTVDKLLKLKLKMLQRMQKLNGNQVKKAL